jgi:hypothetical protein
MWQKFGNGFIDDCCGDHQPDCPRILEFANQVDQRLCPSRIILHQFADCLWRPVKDHAVMSTPDQPAHHVGAHAAEAYHS